MTRPRLWLALALATLSLGCGERALEPEPEQDATLVELEVMPGFYTGEAQPLELVIDGDVLSIRFAAQGGYAAFVGARVNGLEPGLMKLEAELIDPDTLETFVRDSRVVNCVSSVDGSGAVEPDARSASQYAHLVTCPNYGQREVHGLEWILRVTASDPDDERRQGAKSVRVTPICAPGPRHETCVCECEPDYFFAKCGAPH